jgi:uncharacterized protein YbjT (DUF2867 family)
MKILLTGSSGFIGRHIKQTLDKTEHELVTPSHKEADFNIFNRAEQWLPLLKDIDVVINSVGIIVENKQQCFVQLHTHAPSALFQACVQSGVKRIIQISALGADQNAFTAYQKSKLAADNILRDLPLIWTILRPSLVYGEGGASLAMFSRLAALPLIPLPDGGRQQVQPVHISDLVAAVLQSLQADNKQTIDIVGPQAITLAEYIQAIRVSLGKSKAHIISIPSALILASSQLGKYILPIMHPDNLRMLQQGSISDATPFSTLLGHLPLSVKEGLQKIKEEKNGLSIN